MLEISFKRIDTVAVLELSGSLDIDSSNLVEKVGWCIENGYRDLLCSFEDVNVADYAGLSALALSYKNVVNHQGRMKFVNVPVHIKRMFGLVCLDRVFEIYEELAPALKSFEEDRIISEIQKKQLRRRFKRLPLDIGIGLKAKQESEFIQAKVLNISALGMLVFADKIYPLGQVLDVQLKLKPVAELLETETIVVWLVEKKIQPQIYPGMGVEFYHIAPPIQEKIAEFVERNLAMDSEV